MSYVSTRGGAPAVDFAAACLNGLAPDGGLYVPASYPSIAPPAPDEPYARLAGRIMAAFAEGAVAAEPLADMADRAYAAFSHAAVAPLVQIGPAAWLLELHHGPTLAFKDVAMQMLAQLYDHLLAARGDRMTIICATSGDTGGAAAAAFAGSQRVRLVILHPHGRISPVQRRFMTTTGADNVVNLAIDGDFDDAQAIVKRLFADRALCERVNLSGVNSINWARIAAQSVYYASAQAALGAQTPLRFIVPSGNMGDALAGYVAARCGLLTGGFEAICAVNENRALCDLFEQGAMRRTSARATLSPAMDITTPSNFERLLFEASGRDPAEVRAVYYAHAQSGEARLPEHVTSRLGCIGLSAQSVDDQATSDEIARTRSETGLEVCPHTAVALAAARRLPERDARTVVFATAHAAKFPETVEAAIGRAPNVPRRAEAALSRPERFERIPADEGAVRSRLLADGHA